ncbi:hepatocyte nuclear factor 3-gamma-like [Pecten maximus]|uniref:hepatocyte nuclear factor 3-gamma-like n=1 Tax=Pecten maximus TaxID=6579 RepID=UPI001458B108|nr:hepatocyte nuclear factor 3-gamma-like [Pecten maximus]
MLSSTFSIDYLTSKENNCGLAHNSTGSDEGLRHSLVPSMSNSSSGSESENQEVFLSLDKSAKTNMAGTSDAKPAQSYIAMISMAILSSPAQKMLLCDIYQYIMDNFRFYNNTKKAWRNSIRHNLSLNECFVKSGHSENGKGHYWSIHPACIEDFSRGDFRRRQARRRARNGIKEVDTAMSSMKGGMNDMVYVPMTSSPVGYHNQAPHSCAQTGWSGGGSGVVSPQISSPSFFQSTFPGQHRISHPPVLDNMDAW